ncbi:translation initiation factor Sui1 [Posidoniimonas polymericola]|uniref:Translation initiation factor Sui1 n=1 Tax=Posidoniimonas polymericola TaxID=2528002 RepID=A0A5C5YSM6_9BACT|nr:translation initiation factor [Posidoniimonas polymericola]TWT77801.1 translation initiation factor Sui1 [Posidoniimonas polymericola]
MPGLFDGTPLERPVTCDRCGRELSACSCPPETANSTGPPPHEQQVRVRRERRRGKWSTVIAGLESDAAGLKQLLSELRTTLGAGGGVSDGELVLQGDHRDKVIAHLATLGYRAKASGG